MKRLLFALLLFVVTSATAYAGASDPFDSWGTKVPIRAVTHFADTYATHARVRAMCGRPTGREWEGKHGVWHQQFQRCQMREAPVQIVAPAPARTPTSVPRVPTATPISQPIIPGPIGPTLTPTPDTSSPVAWELHLLNADRAAAGVPPLTLDAQQSAATQKHSDAEAATGSIWHVNAAYPQQSFPQTIVVPFQTAGENTGMYGPGDVRTALSWIDQSMLSEPHSPGCTGNHACNILQPAFTHVGIGITTSGGVSYQVTDFTG